MVENAKNSLRSNGRRRKTPPADKPRPTSTGSDKSSSRNTPREQPQQPLYSTLAHVFQIDPDTKKSWLPISKTAINVSFYYDSSKFIYKVLSVDGSKVWYIIFVIIENSSLSYEIKACPWTPTSAYMAHFPIYPASSRF
jgi:hypothetical protein